MKPFKTYTSISKGKVVHENDIRVFASLGSHRYRDERMRQVENRPVSLEQAELLLATYGGPKLSELINGHTITLPKIVSEDAFKDVVTSADRLISWYVDEMGIVEEEEVEDELPFFNVEFEGEFLDANPYYYSDDLEEEKEEMAAKEPVEREFDDDFFNAANEAWRELLEDEEELY